MNTTPFHALAAIAVIGGAASLALAFPGEFDITRPGPTEPAPYQCLYKFKVKGSKSKGSEKYHMSVGNAVTSDTSVEANGSLEASKHDRPSFFFQISAPVGDGKISDTSMQLKYDTSKLDAEETGAARQDFAQAVQSLDADIASGLPGKKVPRAINGPVNVERLKVKGRLKLKNGELSGSVIFSATGSVLGGENAGNAFKGLFKAKFKKARQLELQ